jgi:hypothetical protein
VPHAPTGSGHVGFDFPSIFLPHSLFAGFSAFPPGSPSPNFSLQTCNPQMRILHPGRLSRDISTSYGSIRMIAK